MPVHRHRPRTSTTRAAIAGLLVTAVGVAGGCGEGTTGSGLRGSIVISGSSTVEPISTRVAELFNDSEPRVDITVDGPGTGDGFLRFCKGELDISDASRRIKTEEQQSCAERGIKYVELAIAFDGLSVLTNTRNADISCLSLVDLYALIGPEARGYRTWADALPLARELGSSTALPATKLKITGPGTESGTYDSFVELAISPIAKQRVEAGQLDAADEKTTRPDYTSASDDNTILANIAGSTGSLGWVGFAFAEEAGDGVKELAIDKAGDGRCVEPTTDTIASGTYPLSRTLYIYVNTQRLARNPALAAYVDFYVGAGYTKAVTTALGTTGYIPLPAEKVAATAQVWADARASVGVAG